MRGRGTSSIEWRVRRGASSRRVVAGALSTKTEEVEQEAPTLMESRALLLQLLRCAHDDASLRCGTEFDPSDGVVRLARGACVVGTLQDDGGRHQGCDGPLERGRGVR
jgi:hypothetical protein